MSGVTCWWGSRGVFLGLIGIVGSVVLTVAVVAVVLVALVIADPSAEEVVRAFRDEGLEAGEVHQIDRDADPSFVPKTYEEQVSFHPVRR